jgi:hypothetical protein
MALQRCSEPLRGARDIPPPCLTVPVLPILLLLLRHLRPLRPLRPQAPAVVMTMTSVTDASTGYHPFGRTNPELISPGELFVPVGTCPLVQFSNTALVYSHRWPPFRRSRPAYRPSWRARRTRLRGVWVLHVYLRVPASRAVSKLSSVMEMVPAQTWNTWRIFWG